MLSDRRTFGEFLPLQWWRGELIDVLAVFDASITGTPFTMARPGLPDDARVSYYGTIPQLRRRLTRFGVAIWRPAAFALVHLA